MKTISKETLAMLREKYPKGTKVELVHMDDPHTRLIAGDEVFFSATLFLMHRRKRQPH